jgi:hypothetical protein
MGYYIIPFNSVITMAPISDATFKQKNAKDFVLESAVAVKIIRLLLQSPSGTLTNSEIAAKLGWKGRGSANNVIKVMVAAGLLSPLDKQGVKLPYQVNWDGVFSLAKYSAENKVKEIKKTESGLAKAFILIPAGLFYSYLNISSKKKFEDLFKKTVLDPEIAKRDETLKSVCLFTSAQLIPPIKP